MSNRVQKGLRRFRMMVREVEKVLERITKGPLNVGSKSRRLRRDRFIYRLNSLLINCWSFRVLIEGLVTY